MFIFNILDFRQLVIAYIAALSLPTLIIFVQLIREKQVSFSWDGNFYRKRLVKTLVNVSFYGILMSYTGILVLHIDTIMINHFNGLSDTGVYSITFFFGTLILIPGRPLSKIAGVVIADAFRKKDINNVETIYTKSIINQALIGTLVFIGIWANIDNVFRILPEEYAAGKYVIFFIALANLFDMFAGVSHLVIFNSKYYRMMTVFLLIFVVLIIGTNLIFIPILGIVGAAIASAISRFIYTMMRIAYVNRKFKFTVFDLRWIKLLIVSVAAYLVGVSIPVMDSLILDIGVRSAAISLIFAALAYVMRISEDMNERLQVYAKLVLQKLK